MQRFLLCCVLALLTACSPASTDSGRPSTETISFETREGRMLAFDVSPDDRTIVFDLLGQLWSLPAAGGRATPITDAVRDTAEDLDPSFSPDGRSVVFRAERHGRTGLWLLDVAGGSVRQLTQLPHADGFDGLASWSPDGRVIAFTRFTLDSASHEWHSRIHLLDVASGSHRELRISGLKKYEVRDPVWTRDGRNIAFVSSSARSANGGRIRLVARDGGEAVPLSNDTTPAIAPAFSPDGKRIAFLARDSAQRFQLYVQELADRTARPTRVTDHEQVSSTRVRWTHDGSSVLYAADAKLMRTPPTGGQPTTIAFDAKVDITRAARSLPPATIIEAGQEQPVRAYLGIALAPDARTIAAIALGKLWIIPVTGAPRAIASVPFTARGMAWSSDGSEVAWSAGPFGEEDLFAADVQTGAIRQVTALPGREALPAYAPDGSQLAFMHQKGEAGALRLIDARAASAVRDTTATRNLGAGTVPWTRTVFTYPQWSPNSDALLLVADFETDKPTQGILVPLTGARDTIERFVDSPIFIHWNKAGHLTFVRHDRLWQAAFDGRAVRDSVRPLGNDAALYASASNDGSILYISADGLRLRAPSGDVRRIGWPITYTPPVAAPLMIRNVRIVDGNGHAATPPRDILIEKSRITRIAPPGSIATQGQTIDGSGKFVMPGLMDLHAHDYQGDLLPAIVYFGVTTVRDQGSAVGPLVAWADAIAAGVVAGPRVMYGGFQFYSDWPFDDEEGRGIEPEADKEHVTRSVALAHGLGAQHIKTRTFRRWDINARMIAAAHARGMRATGHCAAPLPLIAAGMDAKEHLGMCATRGAGWIYEFNDVLLYDDEVQLFRAAGVGVVPTLSYYSFAVRMNENPKFLDADTEVAPFVPPDVFGWMLRMTPAERANMLRYSKEARATALKLARAGVTIGTGTDIWQVPSAVHMELEDLVVAGLTPAEAIRAGTSGAARIAGVADALGSVEEGKLADLIVLDADPLADIRNTRRISAVVQNGRVVDRALIRRGFATTAMR